MGDLPPQAHPGLPKGTSIEHRNKQVLSLGLLDSPWKSISQNRPQGYSQSPLIHSTPTRD